MIIYFKYDVTKMSNQDVENVLKMAEYKLGSIDTFIYCVGKSQPVMFITSDVDKFYSHMESNFFSAVKFLLPVANRMVRRKQPGRICLVGDPTATQSTIPGMTPYACSKASLEKLALQLKAELEPHGIRVHYFLPPAMHTEFFQKQKKVYPWVTEKLMKNRRPCHPSYAATQLMNGFSMN